MHSKKAALPVVALVLLLALSPALSALGEGTGVGEIALDFTLNDLEGKPHTLSDYRGGKVMLYFWATW